MMESIKTTSMEKRVQQYLAKIKYYLRRENKVNDNKKQIKQTNKQNGTIASWAVEVYANTNA